MATSLTTTTTKTSGAVKMQPFSLRASFVIVAVVCFGLVTTCDALSSRFSTNGGCGACFGNANILSSSSPSPFAIGDFLASPGPSHGRGRDRAPSSSSLPLSPSAGFLESGVGSGSGCGRLRRQASDRRRTSALHMSSRGGRGGGGGNRDFYAILGVDRSADSAAIKRAYRKLAKQYHPDANPDGDTTEQFQEINRAYEVLANDTLRKRYDQFGEAGIGTSAASDSAAGSPFGGPGGPGGFGAEVDLSDIFDTFFGGGGGAPGGSPFGGRPGGFGGGQRTRRGPAAGDDLRFDLEIDFKTGVFGGEEKVRIRHLEKCGTCDGDGIKPGSAVTTCAVCNGAGVTMQVTRTPLGNFQTQQMCANCRGTGQKVEEYCGTCSGQGLTQKAKQIKVTIPPGVEDGNKLRVRGEGDAGPKGGPAGDLYIFLKVKEDKNFRREGPEIYSDVKVSYVDAILGASVKVPVVDGEVTIKVPPGTQPGQVMRLKGSGAPSLGNANQRGDHYVTVNVDIPTSMSKEEEELVNKLREVLEKKSKKNVFQ